jgi:hypothetical protein
MFLNVTFIAKNGNTIIEAGQREEVYATIQMEAVAGLELEVQLWSVLQNKMLQVLYKILDEGRCVGLYSKIRHY